MFRQTVTGIETQLGPQVNLADKFELNQELAVIEVETAKKLVRCRSHWKHSHTQIVALSRLS